MNKLLTIIFSTAFLLACESTTPSIITGGDTATPSTATPVPTGLDGIARETAKTIVKPIVAAKFPEMPTDMLVNCVMDNATTPEIMKIAENAVTGTPEQNTALTLEIAKRPATTNCIAKGASNNLLNLNK